MERNPLPPFAYMYTHTHPHTHTHTHTYTYTHTHTHTHTQKEQYPVKSNQVSTFLLQTPIVYTEVTLTWKELKFLKEKPKGTNPAIMGNPINMYAVNGGKKLSILH